MDITSVPGTRLLLQLSESLQQLRVGAIHPCIDNINRQLWTEAAVAVQGNMEMGWAWSLTISHRICQQYYRHIY